MHSGSASKARAFYVIDLESYEPLDHPLSIPDFIQAHPDEIMSADAGEGDYPFVKRRDGVRPQLQYLTKATPALLGLLASALTRDDVLAESAAGTDLGLWMGRVGQLGLATILKEKFGAHVRSNAYMARLVRWFATFRSVLGPVSAAPRIRG
jgi:hypothetical protein